MLSRPAFRQMSTTLPPSVPGNEIKQLSFPSTWPVYWLLSGKQPDLPPPTHTQTHLLLVTEFLGGFKNNNEHGGNNQYPPWPRCWSSVGVNSGLFFYSSLSGWKNFSHWLMVAQWWRIRLQEMQVQFLGLEDPLEKGMATHSSVLAWRIPCTEKPDGQQSMGPQRVEHNWAQIPP